MLNSPDALAITPNSITPGDALSVLRTLPGCCVDCCVTSPPYYGLRDYGTASWQGGDPGCSHEVVRERGFEQTKQATSRGNAKPYKAVCSRCGGVRIDAQIGLENTPEGYVARLQDVFGEVRRVLKPDGTLWLIVGDTYWGGKGTIRPADRPHPHIKAKDLIGIPWMLAFALRSEGWYLRQDIIWHKRNPMPESVRDRCTKAHEHIFLLSKSKQYYFDSEAIAEKAAGVKNGVYVRNKRDVWTVNAKPCCAMHFATYPQELIVDCISAGCRAGGLVLDPFMGSGTTALVARKLSRSFFGVELNPEYVSIAEARLREELGLFP